MADNWMTNAARVLLVNPEASLHHRVALGWAWAEELEHLIQAAWTSGDHSRELDGLLTVVAERSRQLRILMEDLGEATKPAPERGEAQHG